MAVVSAAWGRRQSPGRGRADRVADSQTAQWSSAPPAELSPGRRRHLDGYCQALLGALLIGNHQDQWEAVVSRCCPRTRAIAMVGRELGAQGCGPLRATVELEEEAVLAPAQSQQAIAVRAQSTVGTGGFVVALQQGPASTTKRRVSHRREHRCSGCRSAKAAAHSGQAPVAGARSAPAAPRGPGTDALLRERRCATSVHLPRTTLPCCRRWLHPVRPTPRHALDPPRGAAQTGPLVEMRAGTLECPPARREKMRAIGPHSACCL